MGAERGRDRRYGASRLSDDTTRSYGSDKGMYAASGVGITLTQPLWDGFATRSRVRTGEATVESMEYRVFDNATSFGLDGLIAHVDYLRRREILRLAQENVARHKENPRFARERLNLRGIHDGRPDPDGRPPFPRYVHPDGRRGFVARSRGLLYPADREARAPVACGSICP